MSRTDRERLGDALVHVQVLRQHLSRGGLDDQTVVDAVCLRLAAAIEAVAGLELSRRVRTFGSDWPVIWATRNRIAHGYLFIDRTTIAATVERDVPGFEAAIRTALTEWGE